MFHFGYGSNLNLEFLHQYLPSARFIMKAYLPNYEVQFRFWSKKRQGGISSIIEKPGGLVHGVIYECDESEIKELDILESVPQGLYKREVFKVLGEDGKAIAFDGTFEAIENEVVEEKKIPLISKKLIRK